MFNIENFWAPHVNVIGIIFIIMGLFAGWYYYRVTLHILFRNLSLALIILGFHTLLFFRSPIPSAMNFIGELLCLIFLFSTITGILTVMAMEQAALMGYDETTYIDFERREVRPWVTPVASALVFLYLKMFERKYFVFMNDITGGNFIAKNLAIIGIFAVIAIWARNMIPWKLSGEVFVTSADSKSFELEKLFEKRVSVTRLEVFLVPTSLLAGFGLALFFIKEGKKTAGDWVGLLILAIIVASVIMRELELHKEDAGARAGKEEESH